MRWLALLAITVTVCSGLAHGGSARDSDLVAAYKGFPHQWQWRYWVTKDGYDPDKRLDQTVKVEILGRALRPTLTLLTKKTGVSLQILADDVGTLGERKITIISQRSSLKAIMVQIPSALQECHWDIDRTGAQPIYYLHRDPGGIDPTGQSQQEAARKAEQAMRRAERLEEVARALAMSPEELEAYKKEDLFLALALQDPQTRSDASLFLLLPPEQFRTFIDTGRVQPKYRDLPAAAKAGFERLLTNMTVDPNVALTPGWKEQETYKLQRESVERWRQDPDARVDFVDVPASNPGGLLAVGIPNVVPHSFLTFPIPRKYPSEEDRTGLARSLFSDSLKHSQGPYTREGVEQLRAEADKTVSEWIEKGRKANAQWDSSQRQPAQEPTDPELLKSVRLTHSGPTELLQVQREIAAQTGLSLLSDYFSERPVSISGSLTQPIPLWRLLNAISTESDCIWKKSGYHVVFHHVNWSGLAAGEIPEVLLIKYRTKLAKVGHLTIEDAAEFAKAWEGKPKRAYGIPMDLQDAGLNYDCDELLLYASLTPRQIAAAHRPSGLPCSEFSRKQQQRAIAMFDRWSKLSSGPKKSAEDIIKEGSLHIEEKTQTLQSPPLRITTVLIFIQLGKQRPESTPGFWFKEKPSPKSSRP